MLCVQRESVLLSAFAWKIFWKIHLISNEAAPFCLLSNEKLPNKPILQRYILQDFIEQKIFVLESLTPQINFGPTHLADNGIQNFLPYFVVNFLSCITLSIQVIICHCKVKIDNTGNIMYSEGSAWWIVSNAEMKLLQFIAQKVWLGFPSFRTSAFLTCFIALFTLTDFVWFHCFICHPNLYNCQG